MTKTWQFNVNNAQAAQGTPLADNKMQLLAIKNALIGFGTQPWTVVSSSNSVTASNADNWSTVANLVWNSPGSAHSWIVLKQTGIGSNFQVLIACDVASATGASGSIKISPSTGFTGGTTTANPTAADSFNLINVASFLTLSADAALRWSVMQSTDGQCTRIFGFSGGSLLYYGMFEKGANATGGTPGATNSGWGHWIVSAPSFAGTTSQNGINAATVPSYESTANISIASEVDGAWDIFPVGIACTATVGARGRLFTLQDVWFSSSGIAAGDTFPATGSPTSQFIVIAGTAAIGAVVLPWNNGAFNLT